MPPTNEEGVERMIGTCRQIVFGVWRVLVCAVSAAVLLAPAPASALVVPYREIWHNRSCSENHSADFTVRNPGFLELDIVHTNITLGKLFVRDLSKPEDSNLVWHWHHPEHWNMGIQYRTRSPQLSPGRYKVQWEETGHSAACHTSLALRG
jgi:hypothetical protein